MQAITMRDIERAVAAHFRLPTRLLHTADRTQEIAKPRQVVMAIAREKTGRSWPEISSYYGYDHTTALHAHKAIYRDEWYRAHADAVLLKLPAKSWKIRFGEEHATAISVGDALRGFA